MLSPAQFAMVLRRAEAATRGNDLTESVHEVLEHVAADAREMIGNDNVAEWPELAAATVEDKERKGYRVPAPLERTGLLKQSISAEASRSGNTVTGIVGSDDGVVAVAHEFGTSKIPPRPFLSASLMQSQHVVEEAMGQFLVKVLTNRE